MCMGEGGLFSRKHKFALNESCAVSCNNCMGIVEGIDIKFITVKARRQFLSTKKQKKGSAKKYWITRRGPILLVLYKVPALRQAQVRVMGFCTIGRGKKIFTYCTIQINTIRSLERNTFTSSHPRNNILTRQYFLIKINQTQTKTPNNIKQ